MFQVQFGRMPISAHIAGGARAMLPIIPKRFHSSLSRDLIDSGLTAERIVRIGSRGGWTTKRTIQASAAQSEHDGVSRPSDTLPQHSQSLAQAMSAAKSSAELTAAYRDILRRVGDGPTRFRRGAQALAYIERWQDNETLLAVIASQRRLLLFRQVVPAVGRAMRQVYVKDPRFDQVSEKLRATQNPAVLHGLLDSHIDAHDVQLTYEAGKTVKTIRMRIIELLKGPGTRHFDPLLAAALAARIQRDEETLSDG